VLMPDPMRRRSLPIGWLCAALIVAAAAPVHAQNAPAFGGAEVRAGLTFPERATAALSVMAEGDLGYVLQPQLRLVAGLSRFSANIDREPGDNEGSFTATGVWLGARYDIVRWGAWGPYLRGSLGLQRVTADAWDPDVGALLSGVNAGASLALGGRYAVDAAGRLSGTFEVRRTVLNNMNQTTVEVGARLLRRGAYAYVPDVPALRAAAPWRAPATTAPVAAAPQPPAAAPPPLAQPAPATEAERAREEAARAAAERLRRERATEAARVAAAASAERAVAAEARLRQGLDRAAAVMTNVSAVRETQDAFVVVIGGGAFASGAGALASAARAEIRALATVLAGYPGYIVMVEGHTDAQGDATANQALSVERAAAVRAALIVEGVDPLWTAARGFGQSRPIASNETAAGRAMNRRVEVHISRSPCTAPPLPAAAGALTCPPG
jgi:outer membrane protein OmpA-like peptidoglycan-associated protein